MSGARETTLTSFVLYLSPLKLKSCTGHNSHTACDNLILFGRYIYQIKKDFHMQEGQLLLCYTPYVKYVGVYIVFAFPFVRSFVLMYVHSFVFPSHVKVYKTSYFEDSLMDFIHIWPDGRYRSKVFISTIPNPGVTLGSRSRTWNFHKKVKFFVFKFI